MTFSAAYANPETLTEHPDHKRYFIEKLGLSERLMERCLGEALSAGGDYADLYFEAVTSTSLGIDEGCHWLLRGSRCKRILVRFYRCTVWVQSVVRRP